MLNYIFGKILKFTESYVLLQNWFKIPNKLILYYNLNRINIIKSSLYYLKLQTYYFIVLMFIVYIYNNVPINNNR